MTFHVQGNALSITSTDVLHATRGVQPNPIDSRHRYFVELHEQQFPIKQVLRLVTGLPSASFTAGDAHRILSRLGFDISARSASSGAAAREHSDEVEQTVTDQWAGIAPGKNALVWLRHAPPPQDPVGDGAPTGSDGCPADPDLIRGDVVDVSAYGVTVAGVSRSIVVPWANIALVEVVEP